MKWYFSVINTVSVGYQTKINEYSEFQRFFFQCCFPYLCGYFVFSFCSMTLPNIVNLLNLTIIFSTSFNLFVLSPINEKNLK